MNTSSHFRLGTRGSPLALWQARRVQALLADKCPDAAVEIVVIHTTGDKILDKPLVQLGGKGVFTKEIEHALLAEEIDFAVHSFKDLPTRLPDRLAIVSVPERDSPFDALLAREGRCLKELPAHPVIATGSLRRRAQVLAARPDASVVDLRGNVNTRLRKYHESNWDAMIMAEAGLRRMGWTDQIAGILPLDEMLPAPAQGALAIEARLADERTQTLLRAIHDEAVAAGAWAERSFLTTLEGGCQVPIAAYAEMENGCLILHGLVSSLDGTRRVRESESAGLDHPEETGRRLAERIWELGGNAIIEELKSTNQSR
ncbi:MAG TPA: hydroxymethylbilane synthase [bacterium]|nr:hydroxymethylbilane synthase [Candidatus Omnitrophota bacterium]HOJ61167.1 hydroxymethylbilane synthase [bacterium]